jgi:hypothetical protein
MFTFTSKTNVGVALVAAQDVPRRTGAWMTELNAGARSCAFPGCSASHPALDVGNERRGRPCGCPGCSASHRRWISETRCRGPCGDGRNSVHMRRFIYWRGSFGP